MNNQGYNQTIFKIHAKYTNFNYIIVYTQRIDSATSACICSSIIKQRIDSNFIIDFLIISCICPCIYFPHIPSFWNVSDHDAVHSLISYACMELKLLLKNGSINFNYMLALL